MRWKIVLTDLRVRSLYSIIKHVTMSVAYPYDPFEQVHLGERPKDRGSDQFRAIGLLGFTDTITLGPHIVYG